ncbi:hypothetical protein KHA93_16715 [Bacillus sp. FJAT-49732]|uniref:Uncharacterized protein n=1 Tax=Lederbergia citrisecunda TaxID=2833583 RepID=A0A942TN02_9BACI|nr:hypothetical protein [Lederbergia citrisecunda]MBS4201281.1 hypothetical protein [Lederbergia citrisecunda]
MDKKRLISIPAKVTSIVFIVIALLGLSASTVSQIFTEGHGILLYIINAVGDLFVLLGAIQLFRGKQNGKTLVIVGSILFGTYGIFMLGESILGGAVTVLIALIFIILTRYVVISN